MNEETLRSEIISMMSGNGFWLDSECMEELLENRVMTFLHPDGTEVELKARISK